MTEETEPKEDETLNCRKSWRALLTGAALSGIVLLAGLAPAVPVLGANRSVVPAAPYAGRTVAQSSASLTAGCNIEVLNGVTVGGTVRDWVMQHVQPASAVIGIWHLSNATQSYQALYFPDAAVPVDQSTFTTPTDAYFICVNANATLS